jgi:hypothetical protein
MNESTKQSDKYNLRIFNKIPASWTRSSVSTNLFGQIYSLIFAKYSKTVIMLEKSHQHDAEQKKKIKSKDFQTVPS